MKKWRRMVSSLLAAALLLTAVPTVWAAEEDTGFSDVAADAWYAGAVEYVRDNGLMSGTGSATFSPNAATVSYTHLERRRPGQKAHGNRMRRFVK